jgi:hypothetical protein
VGGPDEARVARAEIFRNALPFGMEKSTEKLAAELQAKAVRAIWAGTVWIPFGQLANLASVTTDTVDQWIRERKVFALELDGERYFPSYAFDSTCKPLSAVADVMRIFKDFRSDEAIAAWFESTSSFLGGARPRELVASAPERVVAGAQDCVNTERYAG